MSTNLKTLKKRKNFQKIAQAGRKVVLPWCVVQALQVSVQEGRGVGGERGDSPLLRVGFVITRKYGCAVVRNRARRRFKGALREILQVASAIIVPRHVVVIPRKRSDDTPFSELCLVLCEALVRLGVLEKLDLERLRKKKNVPTEDKPLHPTPVPLRALPPLRASS